MDPNQGKNKLVRTLQSDLARYQKEQGIVVPSVAAPAQTNLNQTAAPAEPVAEVQSERIITPQIDKQSLIPEHPEMVIPALERKDISFTVINPFIENPADQKPQETAAGNPFNPFPGVQRPVQKTVASVEADSAPQNTNPENSGGDGAFPSMKPIHTFTTDVTESIKKEKTSVADIAQEEQKRRRLIGEPTENTGLKTALLIVFSILLFTLGGGSLYYFLVYKKAPTVVVQQVPQYDFIAVDNRAHIQIGASREATLQLLKAQLGQEGPQNGLQKIVIDTVGLDTKATEIETKDFFRHIGLNAPNVLMNSLENTFIFGTVNVPEGYPVFIFKVKDYRDAVAGMFTWEQTLIKDTQDLFLKPENFVIAPYYSSNRAGQRYQFEDAYIQNQAIRIIRTSSGTLFYYFFFDKDYLVFANKESALKEIVSRITKSKYKR